MRRYRLAVLALLALGLGACSVTANQAGGPVQVQTELAGIGPRNYVVTPGGAIQPVPPPPPGNIPPSGGYRGVGTRINDPGGDCVLSFPVINWFVRGDRVSFGAFHGLIRADGVLVMQAGDNWIFGTFHGEEFVGEFWRPGPACDYRIVMQPVR